MLVKEALGGWGADNWEWEMKCWNKSMEFHDNFNIMLFKRDDNGVRQI